jgi:type VI secretion system protein ImpB
MSQTPGGQKSVGQNRPPRVHIEYKIDRGNGIFTPFVLPFIAVSMGEYRGDAKDPKKIAERELQEINSGNFNSTLAAMNPTLENLDVKSELPGLEGDLRVKKLEFKHINDFRPDAIAQNVPELRKLWELRRELENLKTHIDADKDVEEAVKQLIKEGSQAKLKALASAPKQEEPPKA